MKIGTYNIDEIYQGDCIELMKALPDGCIDAVITDPPYGTLSCSWDLVIPFEPMWEQLKRITKPNAAIVLFGSQPFTSALIMSNIKMFKYEWIWNKKKGGNIFNLNRQPYKIHENIIVFSKNKHTYFPIMESRRLRTSKTYSKSDALGIKNYGDERTYSEKYPQSIIEISNANQLKRHHPTQKPVALIQYLIMTYTNKGDLVLDFTIGSGTTAVAAHKTGRKYLGFELSDEYFDIAKNRIRDETAQLSLEL